jgi:hypothetical protein
MDTSCTEPIYAVEVRFGKHLIASYRGPAARANRYAASMQRRFTGLRVTTAPIPPAAAVRNLPDSGAGE